MPLKLDPYSRASSDDTALDELIDLYPDQPRAATVRGPLHPAARAAKVDSIGEDDDEVEVVDEQPRYTRAEKGKSVESVESGERYSSSPQSSSETSSLSGGACPLPSSGLTRDDIVFRVSTLTKDPPSLAAAQSTLAQKFPSLAEPPARMPSLCSRADRPYGRRSLLFPRGAPALPPLPLLPELPNPWDLEITHEGLDISAIQTKTRKFLELPRSNTCGACRKCSGSGNETCRTCRGEAGNECFWCSGSGMQKGRRRCGRCQGQGKLSCMACEGKKASTCRSCDGAGCGEYTAFVEVKMRRIEVPAVSVADLLGSSQAAAATARPDIIKAAAVDMLWELVKMLATKATVKAKRPYLPVSAVCTWEKSVSYLAQVTALQAAKFKAGSKQPFRPEGLTRSVPTKTRYFSLPTDPALSIAELTLDQFVKQNIPEKHVVEVGPATGVHNVSRRLSCMLLGEVSAPSTPQLSSTSGSPKSSTDYFGDVAGAAGAVVSVPVTPCWWIAGLVACHQAQQRSSHEPYARSPCSLQLGRAEDQDAPPLVEPLSLQLLASAHCPWHPHLSCRVSPSAKRQRVEMNCIHDRALARSVVSIFPSATCWRAAGTDRRIWLERALATVSPPSR
ncbi:hypothetical protein L1887_43310 [Cichorium endivia]|nr:hypothetical protein L1887_43310 [Cichorium endivia]